MSKEIVTICVGGCGVRFGDYVWKQYHSEHSISKDGTFSDDNKEETDTTLTNFYQETQNNKYNVRCIMIDSNHQTIDEIKSSNWNSLYDSQYLIANNYDAENNFAAGYYDIGKQMIDKINDKIRNLTENCDNLHGIFIKHAVGGGTGSGLGSLILHNITNNYSKTKKIGFEIYPSPTISTCIVEPYNALLSTHNLLQYLDISINLDNEAAYETIQKWLDVRRPNFNHLNRLIAKPVSLMTAPLRFKTEPYNDLNTFYKNLVPFPRLHFMIASIAPIESPKKWRCVRLDVQMATESCFSVQNFFTKIADFDAEEDKYMGLYAYFRGDVKTKEANATIKWLQTNEKVSLIKQCGECINSVLYAKRMSVLPDDDMAMERMTVGMIGNNTAIGRVFEERIRKRYDLMYSQKAFVHWYVAEGMEQSEFETARENIVSLEKEYWNIVEKDENDEDEKDEDDF